MAAVAATIVGDAVDREQLAKPRSWDIGSIRTFMIVFGLVSSLFDLAALAVLRIGLAAGSTHFRSGWFIESTATELAVMPGLRTSRRLWRSRPGRTARYVHRRRGHHACDAVFATCRRARRDRRAAGHASRTGRSHIGYIGVNELVKAPTGLAA